jgi:hypothetical protein
MLDELQALSYLYALFFIQVLLFTQGLFPKQDLSFIFWISVSCKSQVAIPTSFALYTSALF